MPPIHWGHMVIWHRQRGFIEALSIRSDSSASGPSSAGGVTASHIMTYMHMHMHIHTVHTC